MGTNQTTSARAMQPSSVQLTTAGSFNKRTLPVKDPFQFSEVKYISSSGLLICVLGVRLVSRLHGVTNPCRTAGVTYTKPIQVWHSTSLIRILRGDVHTTQCVPQ